MRGLRGMFGSAGVLLALSACGGGKAPAESPRPVLVAQPGGGATAAYTAYAGEIRAREESPLSFRVAGKLASRSVDVGDHVKQGDVLALLDPDDFTLQAQAAEAQAAAAEAERARTKGDLDRYAKLLDQQLVSRSVYDAQKAAWQAAEGQARAARAQRDVARNQSGYSQLRAPRDGLVASRQVEAGQVVAAGQTVFTLAADSGREVVIALPENRIRQFSVGQPVQVVLWNEPQRRLPGVLREISRAADPQTRTFAARASLEGEAAQAVELGQSARVFIQQNGESAALTVPLSSIQRNAQGVASVWVVDVKTGQVHARPVQLGALGETRVPVFEGVTADDWIVEAGGHLLREGQAVTPVDRDNRPVSAPATASPAQTD